MNNEAAAFEKALRREKPTDELEQAFRQGYLAGQRKEHTMTNENIEDLRKILSHYGTGPQKAKLCEELRELIEAASADSHYETIDTRAHFIEELADVSIMVEQMKLALNLDEQAEYYKTINFKIHRQLGRIANES